MLMLAPDPLQAASAGDSNVYSKTAAQGQPSLEFLFLLHSVGYEFDVADTHLRGS